MNQPGWYPDPEQSGLLRYWDGQRWTAETRPTDRRRRAPRVIIIGAVVLAVVISSVLILVVRDLRNRALIDANPPEPTISGWDDSSPIPTDPATSPTPSSEQSASTPTVPCPPGDPYETSPRPEDGRVHGGGLSYQPVNGGGFGPPEPGGHLGWLNGGSYQLATVTTGWVARFEIGAVPIRDGFQTPKQAAAASMQCLITNGGYDGFTHREDVRDRKISIDGEPGWVLSSKLYDDGAPVPGDLVTMIVIKTGPPGAFSLWMGMVPIDDQARIELSKQAEASLRVT